MKYDCVLQHDINDCGPACLSMIFKAYGDEVSLSNIRKNLKVSNQGASAYRLIKTAKHYGYYAKGVKGEREALFSKFTLPCIAHVVVDNTLLHYIVIYEIKDGIITLADPAAGIKRIEIEDFINGNTEYKWTGTLILISKASKIRINENSSIYRYIFDLLIKDSKLVFLIIFLTTVYNLIGISGIGFYQFVLDYLVFTDGKLILVVAFFLMSMLYVFMSLVGKIRALLILKFEKKIDNKILLDYFCHLVDLPLRVINERQVGEFVSRFKDANSIRYIASEIVLSFFIDVLVIIIGGCILLFNNKIMFVCVCIVVLMYSIIVIIYNRKYEQIFMAQMEMESKLTSYLIESVTGIQTIKSCNTEKIAKEKTRNKIENYLDYAFKNGKITSSQTFYKEVIELIGTVLILCVGARQVVLGKISIGVLVSFCSYLAYFMNPIKNLMNIQPKLKQAQTAYERLNDIMDIETEKSVSYNMHESWEPGDIHIKNLSFAYNDDKDILKKVNVNIKKNSKTAILGSSGSGKSTLLKILVGFYEIDDNTVFVGDKDINKIDKNLFRKKVAYISQDTILFSDSIYNNITMGESNYSEEDIIKACKMAEIHDFIMGLPKQYDTFIEENATNISSGQKQRIAIARILVRNPQILIMDEATSNIDGLTEKKIINNLLNNKELTLIYVSHRLQNVRSCDEILVVEDGHIIESGNHDELVMKEANYYDIYMNQYKE